MWPNRPASSEPRSDGLRDPDIDGGFELPGDGIARGIRVAGDIKGRSDLTIAGDIAGSVFLPANLVRVRATANVDANITARVIEVEGRVNGDLMAAERIVIKGSSIVEGDIISPQVQLEEGCRFKGSVQMSKPDVKRKPLSKPRMVTEPAAIRIKEAVAV